MNDPRDRKNTPFRAPSRAAFVACAVALLQPAPASAGQSGGGTVVDVECELTIHRNHTMVTLWPLVGDIPANGKIEISLSRVGGGGMVLNQGPSTLWRRTERRSAASLDGEYYGCRADASWSNPVAGGPRHRPMPPLRPLSKPVQPRPLPQR